MIKQLFVAILSVLMLMATITGAMATEIKGGETFGDIPMIEMELGELNKPSFWSNFRFQPFVFVDTTASESRTSGDFTVKGTYGAFGLITNGKYSSGSGASAGKQCAIGEYIRLFEYEQKDGKYVYKRDLFTNLYLKESSTDNIAFSNYYLKDFTGYYGYACLERTKGSDTFHYEYYCRNGQVSSSDDKAGNFLCESNTCKISAKTYTSTQTKTQLTNTFCQAVVSNEPAINIIEAKTSKTTYEVGEKVIIKGIAEINKDISGGVIESSLVYTGYATTTPLAVISRTGTDKGVCGDDLTTGVSFNAIKGDKIAFTLQMTAKESGRYNVKVISSEGCGKGIITDKTVSFRINPTPISDNTDDTSGDTNTDMCPDGTYNCHFDFGDDNVNDGDTPINPPTNTDITTIDDVAGDSNTVVKTPNVVTGTVDKYFDYTDNPYTAYGLTAMILLIIILLGYVIFGGKRKGGF